MKRERGSALLIVFLFAAAIALMLYQQMPRVAFEAERDKEQLLIDRGEQYKRAIQMYVVQFKRYPSKIEDLENTNNQRFLRRRYIDPMTGKDQWRLIHVNAAGQLTDSLVQKPPAPATDGQSNGQQSTSGTASSTATNTSGGASSSSGTGTGTDTQPAVNSAVLRRPSDRQLAPPDGLSNPPSSDPNDPRNWPPIALVPVSPTGTPQQSPQPIIPGAPGLPGLPGQPQFPGQSGIGGLPGGFQPGIPGQMPQPNPQFPNGFNPQTPNQTPGLTPVGQLGNGTGGLPNPALGMINSMLRQPSPAATGSSSGAIVTGGLAGVASTSTYPSIKIYKDRQKYSEWEFIFDMKSGLPGQQTPAAAQQNPQNPQNPQGATGQTPQTPQPTTGQNPGFPPQQ